MGDYMRAHLAHEIEGLSVERRATGIDVLWIGGKETVFFLSLARLGRLEEILMCLKEDPTFQGLIVVSQKTGSFIVGAHLGEIRARQHGPLEEAFSYFQYGKKVFKLFEDLAPHTVSLIDGMAIGGGLEVALSTEWMVLTDRALVKAPEIPHGFILGWGGTYWLPRRMHWAGLSTLPSRAMDWRRRKHFGTDWATGSALLIVAWK